MNETNKGIELTDEQRDAAYEQWRTAPSYRQYNKPGFDAGFAAARALLAASPANQVNDARYRKYAARLVDFIQSVQWDDELPRDVDTIVQFWPNAAAIDAAMSASKEGNDE